MNEPFEDLQTIILTFKSVLNRIIELDGRPESLHRWASKLAKHLNRWIDSWDGEVVDAGLFQAHAIATMIWRAASYLDAPNIKPYAPMINLALDGALSSMESHLSDAEMETFVDDVYDVLKRRNEKLDHD